MTVKPVLADNANVLNDFSDFCGSTITKTERTAIFSAARSVFFYLSLLPADFPFTPMQLSHFPFFEFL